MICMGRSKEPSIYHARWCGFDFSSLYPSWRTGQIVGDGSIGYLALPEVPERMIQSRPDTRILFILREPVIRSCSHYWHRVKGGLEKIAWEEAIKSDDSDYLVGYSLYHRHLQRYFDRFPHSQILVVFLEDLAAHEAPVVAEVFEFLGVEVGLTALSREKRNVGYAPRWRLANELILTARKSQRLRSIIPAPARGTMGSLLSSIQSRNKRPIDNGQLKPEHKEYLAARFAPENERLADLLGRLLPW